MKGSKATYRALVDVFEEVRNPLAARAVREIVSGNAVTGLFCLLHVYACTLI